MQETNPTNIANDTKIHIVIPARYQSTRLPGKPLLSIHGKPMILWVAQKASQASFADDLCIATDDKKIATVCKEAGYDVVMTDANHASGTDRLSEVADIKGWGEQDIVVNMQGDEPLVPPMLLQQVSDLLVSSPDCVMSTLCEPITTVEEFHRAAAVKVVMDNLGHALYFSRASIPFDRDLNLHYQKSQISKHEPNENDKDTDELSISTKDLPKHGFRHLGIYAYRVKLLKDFVKWPKGILESIESLEQLRILENGGKIAIAQATVPLPAGVDTQEDLDRLNALPINEFE